MHKHILIIQIISFLFFSNNILSQELKDKKIQMGIVSGTSINLNNTDTKLIKIKNPGYDLTIGMNYIKNYNKNLGFNSGIEFDFSSSKYTFQDTIYYDYQDNLIISKSEIDNLENNKRFFLQERTQKPIYLSIPTMLIFKTEYIGYNRFFAKFGMRHNFVLKNITNDKGALNTTNDRMKLKKDLAIYSGSIGISAGTEWNYYGSSSMLFEIGYYYGISNIHRGNSIFGEEDKNKTLYFIDKTNNKKYQTLQSSRNQIAFKISFLF
jgi:hypothetical protein